MRAGASAAMLADHLDQLKALLFNAVWAVNLAAVSPARAGVLRVLRIGHMLSREISEGHLSVRAARLVYTTLLSLVPVLAVSFAMLKTFGVHQDFEPTLLHLLEPLGDRGDEVARQLVDFVENLEVGRLGAMGLAVLLFTIVSLMHKVEKAFNDAWRVRRPRGMLERFSRYLTVVMIGPVLVFTALTIIGSVTSGGLFQEAAAIRGVGTAIALGSKLVPFVLVVSAFAFTYLYIPNTHVRIRSAVVGALFAGLLWVVAGWLFAEMVVTSARYTAIYRSFALLILFMMWLYIGWLILLAGSCVAFYHQHPEYLGLLRHELRVSNRVKERMALGVCGLVARHFLDGREPWTAAALAAHLRVPRAPLEDLLQVLERNSLLAPTSADPPGYLPARDLASIRVVDVLAAVRSAHETHHVTAAWLPPEPSADEAMAAIEAGIEAAVGERSLRELGRDMQGREVAAAAEAADSVTAPSHASAGRAATSART
jgi:membrane protein